MTRALPFTQMAVRRAIKAARHEGLRVVGIKADGTVLVDDGGVKAITREQARAVWQGRCPATIENVLRGHDENCIDLSVISSPGHYLRQLTLEEAVPELRASNE